MSDTFDLQAHAANIRIILVNTSHPGNIGATARAMKNMGLSRLTLVDPENFPSAVANGRAVSAVDILENARVTKTLEEAVEGCGLVIGASARLRRIPWPLMSPPDAARMAVEERAVGVAQPAILREPRGRQDQRQRDQHHDRDPEPPRGPGLSPGRRVG